MRNLFLILSFFFVLKIHSQYGADKEFLELKKIIASETSLKKTEENLKEFKHTYKNQLNTSVDIFLERDVDFDYIHTRIQVSLEMNNYQIDFVTKHDSVYLKSIKNEYYKHSCIYNWSNEEQLSSYIAKRNSFYRSNKNLKNLFEEICSDNVYAMHCGEAYGLTEQGIKVNQYILNKDFKSLASMLSSFSCETQAFGVYGFSVLNDKITVPAKYLILMEHIKERNSSLQICSGCITGLVEKIYK